MAQSLKLLSASYTGYTPNFSACKAHARRNSTTFSCPPTASSSSHWRQASQGQNSARQTKALKVSHRTFLTSIPGQSPKPSRPHIVRAAVEGGTELEKGSDGPPVQLGTAELPEDINLPKLKQLLYQWANSIVTSAALPLPLPLKVDSINDGVRLAFIRIQEGDISEVFHIDVLVTPKAEGERRPMFRALRDGPYKNTKAPFEPQVMSSLLAALKKSVPLSRGE